MRIGIITLPLHVNYGGIMQSYALQTVLEQMGHSAWVIDKEVVPELTLKQIIRKIPLRLIKKYFLQENITMWPKQHYQHEDYVQRCSLTRDFIFTNINLRKCHSLRDIRKNEFDAFIVGSDQVWRPSYFIAWGDISDAFLGFAENWNVKRISYAASFGSDEWEYSVLETIACKNLARKFDTISVRERNGIALCREHLNINSEFVLDPTFLLQDTDYCKLLPNKHTPIQNKLFCYVLDETEDKITLVNKISADKKLTPFYINKDISASGNTPYQPVEKWLSSFRDSDFIITDSFHACVFSVIFHKPFICFNNEGRGAARFQIFKEELNLSDNIIGDSSEYNPKRDYKPTEITYLQLHRLQKASFNFLKDNLS